MRLSQQHPKKRAFVTGAASGLGLALCRRLAAEGWTLGMNDVDERGLERAVGAVRQVGGTPHPYPFDVADAGAFGRAAEAFVGAGGGVDLVINNAGIYIVGAAAATPLAVWEEAIGINLMGVVHGCHAFLPHLKVAGAGRIINIASIAAVTAAPTMAVYNATKASVLALSETLYAELRGSGVGVTVALPFFFQTNLARALRGTDEDRAQAERILKRTGTTAEAVAGRVLKAAGRGQLYVIYPWKARLLWHTKRLFPERYVRAAAWVLRRPGSLEWL